MSKEALSQLLDWHTFTKKQASMVGKPLNIEIDTAEEKPAEVISKVLDEVKNEEASGAEI